MSTAGELLLWIAAFVHLKVWDRLTHFTWWGILFHVCTVVSALAGHVDWATDICIQCIVIAGVWYMSACECDMLVDTERDMGTVLYAGGNFFVHYFPLVSAVARKVKRHRLPSPTPTLLWLAYNALSLEHGHTPSEIYGCNAPFELVLMVGTSAALAATFFTHKPCASQR